MRSTALFLALLLAGCLSACGQGKPPVDRTLTRGNATDRSPVDGTSGTIEPTRPSSQTAVAAEQLGTVAATNTAPTATTGTVTTVVVGKRKH
jgi:hypothetical protein